MVENNKKIKIEAFNNIAEYIKNVEKVFVAKTDKTKDKNIKNTVDLKLEKLKNINNESTLPTGKKKNNI